jgi:septal ring factor EnvC (AmiA/AmiB activator)
MKSAVILISLILFISCNPFQNKRQQEIRERLAKLQEEIDRKTDSLRREQYKKLSDTTFGNMERTLDSLKKSSDSLEKSIKKNIDELKKKRTKVK